MPSCFATRVQSKDGKPFVVYSSRPLRPEDLEVFARRTAAQIEELLKNNGFSESPA